MFGIDVCQEIATNKRIQLTIKSQRSLPLKRARARSTSTMVRIARATFNKQTKHVRRATKTDNYRSSQGKKCDSEIIPKWFQHRLRELQKTINTDGCMIVIFRNGPVGIYIRFRDGNLAPSATTSDLPKGIGGGKSRM